MLVRDSSADLVNSLRLIKMQGTTRFHKTVRTRVYAAVSTIVGQDSMKDCLSSAHRSAGYDMDYEGTFHASNVFVRDMAWTSTKLNNAS